MDFGGSGPTLEQKFACFERFRMDLGGLVVALWPCANSHLRAGGDARSVRNLANTIGEKQGDLSDPKATGSLTIKAT